MSERMRLDLEKAQARNAARRISETGDGKLTNALHQGKQEDRSSLNTAKKQTRGADESGSAVIKTSEGAHKSFIYRENSSDSSGIIQELESKKMGVFRQYTLAGESINEMEETP